jgi:hypothetical protein
VAFKSFKFSPSEEGRSPSSHYEKALCLSIWPVSYIISHAAHSQGRGNEKAKSRRLWPSKALSSPHLRKGAAHPLTMKKHFAYLSGLYHTLLVMQRIRKGVAMKKPKAVGCDLQKL